MKGVGRVYQQTFIDTYAKVGFAKLYDRKTPITAADLLNDRVLPFFEEHDVKLLRVLTDRGSEYCGNPERHKYELYLAVEDVDHSRTKTKSPQTNGICERFHKTVLNEFYRVAFRKKVYRFDRGVAGRFGFLTMASARLPCCMILSRLSRKVSVSSTISPRVLSSPVILPRASCSSSISSADTPEKLLTKLAPRCRRLQPASDDLKNTK